MNWLPFMALLFGLALNGSTSRLPTVIKERASRERVGLVIALALSTLFFFQSGAASQYQPIIDHIVNRASGDIEARSILSQDVGDQTREGVIVLFWGALPGENFMSKRETPSAYLFYSLYVPWRDSARMDDEFLEALHRRRPVLIVDMDNEEALSLDPQERAQQIRMGVGWRFLPPHFQAFYDFVDNNYSREAVIDGKTIYRWEQFGG